MPGAQFNIGITVDLSSWPAGKTAPTSFVGVGATDQVDYFKMLLTLGILTTPTISHGISLSEYWAQLRYLHAIDFHNNELKLAPEYEDIDTHQKTILSDDFGVGISCDWLFRKLNVIAFCDGRYFIDRLKTIFGATVTTNIKKSGPSKSPDFVVVDGSGMFHAIECKGTQSADPARDNQIRSLDKHGNIKGGGVIQKSVISFPPSIAGERLVGAVKISKHTDIEPTNLKIHDPDGDPVLTLTENETKYVRDPMIRNIAAKAMAQVGAQGIGSIFARSSPDEDVLKAERRAELDQLWRQTSEQEIGFVRGQIGAEIIREQTTDLIKPVDWGGQSYRRVTVRNRCDKGMIERAFEEDASRDPFQEREPYWGEAMFGSTYQSDLPDRDSAGPEDATATLKLGKVFSSELILRS